jgi:hypothetical protein
MAGLLGAIIGGGVNLAKGIFGGIQASKANKQMKQLMANRPQYQISQGYKDAFSTYQRLANSQLPGYDIMQGQIGESTAKTMDYAERGAMGSNQYMSAALQSQDKELEAIKNLGLMSAQWRGQQQQNLIQGQQMMGQQQDVQFQTNQLDPWNMKANMAAEKAGVGMQNLFSGIEGLGSSINNFAGTNAYLKALKSLQPQNNNAEFLNRGGIQLGNTGATRLQSPLLNTNPLDSYNGFKGKLL